MKLLPNWASVASLILFAGCSHTPSMVINQLQFDRDAQYRFVFKINQISKKTLATASRTGKVSNNSGNQNKQTHGFGTISTSQRLASDFEAKNSRPLGSLDDATSNFFYGGKPKNRIEPGRVCFKESCFQLFKAVELDKIGANELTISYVDTTPVWRASDEYFTARNLPVPEKYSKHRYLKAPFKGLVLYTSEGFIIAGSDIFIEDKSLLLTKTAIPDSLMLSLGDKIFVFDKEY